MYLIRRALLYETSEKSMSKNTRNHEYREPLLPAEATLRTKPIKKTNTTLGTVQIQILQRTYLERKLMMPLLRRRHFYVKKGGPKKVLNYADLHVFLTCFSRFLRVLRFYAFFTFFTLYYAFFSYNNVFRRLQRRYLSYGARFCADRQLRFRAIDRRKNELRTMSRSRVMTP